MIFFMNSDALLGCFARTLANRENIVILHVFYWWCVACSEENVLPKLFFFWPENVRNTLNKMNLGILCAKKSTFCEKFAFSVSFSAFFSCLWCFFRSIHFTTMEAIRKRLFVSPGSHISDNGVCLLYDGCPRGDGYSTISFRDPVTGSVRSSSVHRLSVMLGQGNLDLPQNLDASHLCHNKTCILAEHISLEPRRVNCQRRMCVSAGKCHGHGDYPACLLHLISAS